MLNPGDASWSITGGSLVVTVMNLTYWFGTGQGLFVHVPVTGDFVVTTQLTVDNPQSTGVPPAGLCMGFLIAREPAGPPENHVWTGIGTNNSWIVEEKNTTDGATVYTSEAWGQQAKLRLCRRGASFRLMARNPASATWTFDFEHTRSDLPTTLQVGLSAGCNNPPTVLSATFEDIRFSTPTSAADCDAP